MTDPANPAGYVGGWVLYATACGHPLVYAETQLQAQMAWHDLGFDEDHESAADLPPAETRLATHDDLAALRRGDACEACRVSPDPAR